MEDIELVLARIDAVGNQVAALAARLDVMESLLNVNSRAANKRAFDMEIA